MTLLETVVWVGVFTSAMLALTVSVISFYKTNRYIVEEQSAVVSGQKGIDLLVRTLREASYASNGAYPIVSFGPYQVTFYADVDTDAYVEKVSFYISSTSLYEDITDPSGNPYTYGTATSTTKDVADYIRNIIQSSPPFTYFDKNGAQITDYTKIGDVRFVTANLIVDVYSTDQPGQLTLRSSAALRNLVNK